MTFLQEARARWGAAVPPFFKKVQGVCASLIILGGSIAGVTLYSGSRLSWITTTGIAIGAAGTVGGAICQFVVTNIGLIIPAGGSIENKTDNAIEVKPAIDQTPLPADTTIIQPESVLPPPAEPGTP